jgi:hypothetical protein
MDDYGQTPVRNTNFGTSHAAGVVVIGALVVLILIRRGFRGAGVFGANVSVR